MSTLDFKMYDIFDELSRDNRWDFLTILILRANKRLRCWPAMRTIAKKAYPGKMKGSAGNLGMATRAKNWLLAHGAITLVKVEHRIGAEKKLARNRHVYQLTGVIVIDKKVYPYLYIPGREHVSGGETIGDEDVSGGETSGGETSGDEISGGETNHSSVVSGIIPNQESGSDSSSSNDDDDFNLTDKERSIVLRCFGSMTSLARKFLKKDSERALGFAEYVNATRLFLDPDDKRYVKEPSRFMFTVMNNGSSVPDLPIETKEHKLKREADGKKAAMTPDEIAKEELRKSDNSLRMQTDRVERLTLLRDEIKRKDSITDAIQNQFDEVCKRHQNIAISVMLVDCSKNMLTIIELADTSAKDRILFGNELSEVTGLSKQFLNRRQYEQQEQVAAMIDDRRKSAGLEPINAKK